MDNLCQEARTSWLRSWSGSLSIFRGKLMDKHSLQAGILNTSIATENTGDHIIMEAAQQELAIILKNYQTIHFPTHEKISRVSRKLQKKVEFNVACGTNLLHAHMLLIKQWNIGIKEACFMKPVILLGVGWRSQAKRNTDFYTRWLLKKVLSGSHLHSVRDSFTEQRLQQIGINNVVNTGCPTIWSLTEQHCKEIPREKGENVVVTLTDYSQNHELDRLLMNLVLTHYKNVFFWCQGTNDYQYLLDLGFDKKVEVIPPSLAGYNSLLADSGISLDFVGTRLHGGIRALQHKRRTIIIGVDHRANMKGKDFNLPVIHRYETVEKLEKSICDEMDTAISLPTQKIQEWKSQFV